MARDPYKRRTDRQAPPRDGLFGWTVFILLLIGFAFACWIGSYYLFGRPEDPRSYELLKKLGKVEPPKRFELTKAPGGQFLNPQKLYDKYSTMSLLDLENENAELIRAFLNNYASRKRLVTYVIGSYKVTTSQEFKPGDLFPSGMVALAQSKDQPMVFIEHVFSADEKTVPSLQRLLQPGLEFKLERTLDVSAVIHVRKLAEGQLQITCVPLTYGSYQRPGEGRFSLEPPAELNLAPGFPLLQGDKFAAALKSTPAPPRKRLTSAEPGATPAGPQLVRAEETPVPEVTPTPAVAVADVLATPTPVRSSTPRPTVVAALATPTPKAAASITPEPTAAPVSPEGVPLQPFLQAVATPAKANTGKVWRTYEPGRMPLGKLVGVEGSAELAERGVGSEPVYLKGDFEVRATDANRAVLRTKDGSVRVMVDYPAGSTPPAAKSTINRDGQRPFQITDVRRGADGTLNIYVREITRP